MDFAASRIQNEAEMEAWISHLLPSRARKAQASAATPQRQPPSTYAQAAARNNTNEAR